MYNSCNERTNPEFALNQFKVQHYMNSTNLKNSYNCYDNNHNYYRIDKQMYMYTCTVGHTF